MCQPLAAPCQLLSALLAAQYQLVGHSSDSEEGTTNNKADSFRKKYLATKYVRIVQCNARRPQRARMSLAIARDSLLCVPFHMLAVLLSEAEGPAVISAGRAPQSKAITNMNTKYLI